ncbi:hypothetical protein [Nocardia terpenica]|uniref:Uncharacterized protein n=1 Tax=Nocardia terpenica TaxID=455432 RepID=A0A164LDA7_9NOCA|nr:hypothetical protein [Nocardia terpenica]KZM72282.1 hypothetical protein AWN90_37030 [Nocardia terpenica]NQE86572.1 hypothetical protein [Nocardia terpenica]
MNLTIPDDFPDGPRYANLTVGEQYSLLRGWMYCARYDTFLVPSSVWFAFTAGATHTMLERAGLIETSTAPAGVICPGGGRARRASARTKTLAKADTRFDEWWAVWPRKQAKRDAQRAFSKALNLIGFDELMAATQAFASDPNREDRYTPYPATWLNGERWADAPLPADPARTRFDASSRINTTVELGRQLAADIARTTSRPEMRALP